MNSSRLHKNYIKFFNRENSLNILVKKNHFLLYSTLASIRCIYDVHVWSSCVSCRLISNSKLTTHVRQIYSLVLRQFLYF